MKIPGLMRTRVAGRIFALFVVGGVVPVVLLEVLSVRAVSGLLDDQSAERLANLADASAQIVLERLASATSLAEGVGVLERTNEGLPASDRFAPTLPAVFRDVALVGVGAIPAALPEAHRPTPDELERLDQGQAVVRVTPRSSSDDGARLHLGVSSGGAGSHTWAELSADSIWASATVLASAPNVSDMCLVDGSFRALVCKAGPGSRLPERLREVAPEQVAGSFRFDGPAGREWGVWRAVYLRAAYGVDDWYVVLSEPESTARAPVAAFLYNLPLALTLGLGVVLLLANSLVQRTMRPLEELTIGTEAIARRDLSARVPVDSDDEFGALASSFNQMAERLESQFGQIEAAQAIDRAVIEDRNATEAVGTVIDGVERLAAPARCALVLHESHDGHVGLYVRSPDGSVVRAPLDEHQVAGLRAAASERGPVVESGTLPDALLAAGWGRAGSGVALLSMTVPDREVGFVVIERRAGAPISEDTLRRVRRLVDRAAVALNEGNLRRDLVEFGGETLRALANAIDAKSRWTAGHSERVTDLAWAIGRRMGLGLVELETIQRGGLLHDIGKIGVPSEVLDWPGRLSPEQRLAVEAHTTIGARILEPVRVFRPLLPIVLHHHERWDGNGYPHGLRGTEIPLLARVLSVADVFDAMVSPRPYRGPLPQGDVVGYVIQGSGLALDPEVVEAFRSVMDAGWVHDVPREGAPLS